MTRAPAGFEDFARSNARVLHARALLLCRDHHMAEDLVQETLTKLYVRWHRVEETGTPLGYARATLANLYVDRMRRRSQHEPPVEHPVDLPLPGGDDRIVTRVDLEVALARLSPEQRACVVARYLDDLPVATVAAQLGRTDAWVKTTCHRALATLRRDAADLLIA